MNCVATPNRAQGTSLSALATPEPHYIPGYAGYLPQGKCRCGNTYGMTSHRVLIDPCIHMSPRSMLNNIHPEYCTDDFGRPGVGADPLMAAQMALVNSRVNSFGRQQYQADMTPGYTGYIPRFQTILGHTYSPACNRALASFEQDQWRDRLFNKELEALDGWRFCYKTKPWESPEIQRAADGDLQEFARSPCCQQPKFLRNDVQCSTRSGSCGCGGGDREKKQECYSFRTCGCEELNFQELSQDDRSACPCRCGTRLPSVYHTEQIYRGCEGITPDYAGHVPGQQFRIGRTYTASTRNKK